MLIRAHLIFPAVPLGHGHRLGVVGGGHHGAAGDEAVRQRLLGHLLAVVRRMLIRSSVNCGTLLLANSNWLTKAELWAGLRTYTIADSYCSEDRTMRLRLQRARRSSAMGAHWTGPPLLLRPPLASSLSIWSTSSGDLSSSASLTRLARILARLQLQCPSHISVSHLYIGIGGGMERLINSPKLNT